jgi:hypothetical protein
MIVNKYGHTYSGQQQDAMTDGFCSCEEENAASAGMQENAIRMTEDNRNDVIPAVAKR